MERYTGFDSRVSSHAARQRTRQRSAFQRGDGGNVADSSKCKHSRTATPKPRARAQQPVRSRVSSRGRWMKGNGRFKMQALTLCDANHEHARNGRSVQGSVQWGDGTLHMGSIRGKAHSLPNKHMATVSTPVGRWNVTVGSNLRESLQPARQRT